MWGAGAHRSPLSGASDSAKATRGAPGPWEGPSAFLARRGERGGPSDKAAGDTRAVGARAHEPRKMLGTGSLQADVPASGMFSAWLLVSLPVDVRNVRGVGQISTVTSDPALGTSGSSAGLGVDEPAHRAAALSRGTRHRGRSQAARVLRGANASLRCASWEASSFSPLPGAGAATPLPTSRGSSASDIRETVSTSLGGTAGLSLLLASSAPNAGPSGSFCGPAPVALPQPEAWASNEQGQ